MPRGWRNPAAPNSGMLHEDMLHEQQQAIEELVREHQQEEAARAGRRPWWKRLLGKAPR
jgi:hypothetical protein